MGDDPYVEVDVWFMRASPNAICVAKEEDDEPLWIPRSLLHASTDLLVDGWKRNDTHTIKAREWKVRQLGL